MRLQEISRSAIKTDAPFFVNGKKNIVTRPATALRFGHAQYSPHYPNPSPHRSFSRLGL
jgi:hypothetical protein